MTTNNVQVPIKKSHKRTKPSSSRNYGGWSTSDHLTFIESFSGLLTIEFRVYDRRWKFSSKFSPCNFFIVKNKVSFSF